MTLRLILALLLLLGIGVIPTTSGGNTLAAADEVGLGVDAEGSVSSATANGAQTITLVDPAAGQDEGTRGSQFFLVVYHLFNGPVFWVLVAVGIVATVFGFSMGSFKWAFTGIGGIIFVAAVRHIANMKMGVIDVANGDSFPFFGMPQAGIDPTQSIYQDPAWKSAYGVIETFANMGCHWCERLVRWGWTYGVIPTCILVSGMVAYYRFSTGGQPAALLKWMVTVVLVVGFGLIPAVNYSLTGANSMSSMLAATATQKPPTDAAGAPLAAATSAIGFGGKIPIAPAMLFTGGYHLSNAIVKAMGLVSNGDPGYVAKASVSAELPRDLEILISRHAFASASAYGGLVRPAKRDTAIAGLPGFYTTHVGQAGGQTVTGLWDRPSDTMGLIGGRMGTNAYVAENFLDDLVIGRHQTASGPPDTNTEFLTGMSADMLDSMYMDMEDSVYPGMMASFRQHIATANLDFGNGTLTNENTVFSRCNTVVPFIRKVVNSDTLWIWQSRKDSLAVDAPTNAYTGDWEGSKSLFPKNSYPTNTWTALIKEWPNSKSTDRLRYILAPVVASSSAKSLHFFLSGNANGTNINWGLRYDTCGNADVGCMNLINGNVNVANPLENAVRSAVNYAEAKGEVGNLKVADGVIRQAKGVDDTGNAGAIDRISIIPIDMASYVRARVVAYYLFGTSHVTPDVAMNRERFSGSANPNPGTYKAAGFNYQAIINGVLTDVIVPERQLPLSYPCGVAFSSAATGNLEDKNLFGCLAVGAYTFILTDAGYADLRSTYPARMQRYFNSAARKTLSNSNKWTATGIRLSPYAAGAQSTTAIAPTVTPDGRSGIPILPTQAAYAVAFDNITSSPGIRKQLSLQNTVISNSIGGSKSGNAWSFAGILDWIIENALWLVAWFGSMLSAIVQHIFKYVIGIAIMLFLIISPVLLTSALILGAKPIIGMAQSIIWLSIWPIPISIGVYLINLGTNSSLGGAINDPIFNTGSGSMGSVVKLCGAAMICMAPVFATAAMDFTGRGLQQLGTTVFGTSMQVAGGVAQVITTAIAGILTAATAGAAMAIGAAAGAMAGQAATKVGSDVGKAVGDAAGQAGKVGSQASDLVAQQSKRWGDAAQRIASTANQTIATGLNTAAQVGSTVMGDAGAVARGAGSGVQTGAQLGGQIGSTVSEVGGHTMAKGILGAMGKKDAQEAIMAAGMRVADIRTLADRKGAEGASLAAKAKNGDVAAANQAAAALATEAKYRSMLGDHKGAAQSSRSAYDQADAAHQAGAMSDSALASFEKDAMEKVGAWESTATASGKSHEATMARGTRGALISAGIKRHENLMATKMAQFDQEADRAGYGLSYDQKTGEVTSKELKEAMASTEEDRDDRVLAAREGIQKAIHSSAALSAYHHDVAKGAGDIAGLRTEAARLSERHFRSSLADTTAHGAGPLNLSTVAEDMSAHAAILDAVGTQDPGVVASFATLADQHATYAKSSTGETAAQHQLASNLFTAMPAARDHGSMGFDHIADNIPRGATADRAAVMAGAIKSAKGDDFQAVVRAGLGTQSNELAVRTTIRPSMTAPIPS